MLLEGVPLPISRSDDSDARLISHPCGVFFLLNCN